MLRPDRGFIEEHGAGSGPDDGQASLLNRFRHLRPIAAAECGELCNASLRGRGIRADNQTDPGINSFRSFFL